MSPAVLPGPRCQAEVNKTALGGKRGHRRRCSRRAMAGQETCYAHRNVQPHDYYPETPGFKPPVQG